LRPIIVILIVILLLILAGLYTRIETQGEGEPQLYAGVPFNAKLLELDKRALDDAYHDQIVKLFGVWLTHGINDASNFRRGLQNTRKGYEMAAEQIAKREQERR
jgi:hypothetical protein